MNEQHQLALEGIIALTGNPDPLKKLPEEVRELALTVGGQLFPAVTAGDQAHFMYSVMTLTYLGAGFHGKSKWEDAVAMGRACYRAAREGIKAECRQAVDDLIASIQS